MRLAVVSTAFEVANLGADGASCLLTSGCFQTAWRAGHATLAGLSGDDRAFLARTATDLTRRRRRDGRIPPPETMAFVREAPAHCRRIAATCLATFVLAEAGHHDGRRATTHWIRAQELHGGLLPEISVEEDRIFIADGNVWTSAGTCRRGLDLALAR